MMKLLSGIVLALAVAVTSQTAPLQAATALRVQPTSYRGELKQGERKIGFIDVSNPTKDTLKLTTSVSAFRQVADDGSLGFYESDQVKAGIIPDLSSFELKPLEAMRVYFMLDGAKLPTGDVFGALFFTAQPASGSPAITQPVRLGVLFSLVNGTPGPRTASVSSLSVSFLQFGESVKGSYVIRNDASEGQATGFYPKVRVAITPFDSSKLIDSPLVFAGRTRSSNFNVPTERFGLYQLSVQTGSSEKSQWIFAMTGWGRFVPVAILFLAVLWLVFRRFKLAEK